MTNINYYYYYIKQMGIMLDHVLDISQFNKHACKYQIMVTVAATQTHACLVSQKYACSSESMSAVISNKLM